MTSEEVLLLGEQRKWVLEMEDPPGKDAVKIVEVTAKDLEYCKNLIDKQWQDWRGLTPNLKEALWWEEYYQTALRTAEKSLVKGRLTRYGHPTFSTHHPDRSTAINLEARTSTSKRVTMC